MTLFLGDYPVVLLLVFFRVAGILFVVPLFGLTPGSGWLLAAISFPIALMFCSTLPPEWQASAVALSSPGDIAWAVLGELLLGGAIGAVCGVFVGVFDMAGRVTVQGMSLGMAQEVDPITGESSDIISQIWRMLFLVTALALGAHLEVIRVLAHTFERLPVPWTGWMHVGLELSLLIRVTFETGVLIAMPVMVVALLVSIAMGLMARMAEQFNVMFLSLPFRILAGLLMLMATILLGGGVIRRVASDMLITLYSFVTG